MEKYDIYEVEERDVLGKFIDGGEFVYKTYRPLPREHKLTEAITKAYLKIASGVINDLKDSNDLLSDANGELFYKPSDVSKLFLSKGRHVDKALLIDMGNSSEQIVVDGIVEYNKKEYRADTVIDWSSIELKIMYCVEVKK